VPKHYLYPLHLTAASLATLGHHKNNLCQAVWDERPSGHPRITWMKTLSPTISDWLKQSVWLIITCCGGCWLRVALCTHSGAGQKLWWCCKMWCNFNITLCYPALDEAKAAYRVWLDVRAKRDEMLTEKQNKKPAPYRHVKVDIDFVDGALKDCKVYMKYYCGTYKCQNLQISNQVIHVKYSNVMWNQAVCSARYYYRLE